MKLKSLLRLGLALCLVLLIQPAMAAFWLTNNLAATYRVSVFTYTNGVVSTFGTSTLDPGEVTGVGLSDQRAGLCVQSTNASITRVTLTYWASLPDTNHVNVATVLQRGFSVTPKAISGSAGTNILAGGGSTTTNAPGSVPGTAVNTNPPSQVPASVVIYSGTTAPNGVITATRGSLYNQFSGTNYVQSWVKQTISGSTGWIVQTTGGGGGGTTYGTNIVGQIGTNNLPTGVLLLPASLVPTNGQSGVQFTGLTLKPATNTASTVFWPFASTPFNDGSYTAYPNAGFAWGVVQGTSEGSEYIQTYFSGVPNGYTNSAMGSFATRYLLFNYDPSGVLPPFVRLSCDLHFWGNKIDMEGSLITNAVYQGTFIGDGSALTGISGSGGSGSSLVPFHGNVGPATLYGTGSHYANPCGFTADLPNSGIAENVALRIADHAVTLTNLQFNFTTGGNPIVSGVSMGLVAYTNGGFGGIYTSTGFSVVAVGNGTKIVETNSGTQSLTIAAGSGLVFVFNNSWGASNNICYLNWTGYHTP